MSPLVPESDQGIDESTSPRLSGPRGWLHAHRLPLAIAALGVAVQLIVTTRSALYFDDVTFMVISHGLPWGWDLVAYPANRHLIPLFMVVNKLYWPAFGMAWWPALVYSSVVFAIGVVFLYLLVKRLTEGQQWPAAAAAFVFALSPIPITTQLWWAAALSLTSALTGCLGAAYFFVRWNDDRTLRSLLGMVVAYCFALSAWDKSLLVTVEIFLIGVILLDAQQNLPERVRRAISRWPAWLGLTIPSLLYLSVYLGDGFGAFPQSHKATVFSMLEMAVYGFGASFVPGLASLDAHRASGLPSWPLVALGWLIVIAVVGWIVRTRRGTAPAFVFFAITAAMNTFFLAYGRAGFGIETGLDSRYHLDNLMLACIAFGWALGRPLREGRRPLKRPVVVVLVTAFLISAVISGQRALHQVAGPYRSNWTVRTAQAMETAQSDYREIQKAHPGMPFLDSLLQWIPTAPPYPANRMSFAMWLYFPEARFTTRDVEGMWMQNDGRIVTAKFAGDPMPIEQTASTRCTAAGQEPIVIPYEQLQPNLKGAFGLYFDRGPGVAAVVLRKNGDVVNYLTGPKGLNLQRRNPSLVHEFIRETRGDVTPPEVLLSYDDVAIYASTGMACLANIKTGALERTVH